MIYFTLGDSMKNENVGGLIYEIEVYDKNGKLIDKKKNKGNCILYNLMRILATIRNPSDYSDTFQFKDTSGNPISADQIVASGCSMLAPAGVDSYGIVVGTGTTNPSLDDYNLESKIPHGTESGQLSYGDTTKYDYSESGSVVVDQGCQRSFDNNSGADITVNEIGLIATINIGGQNVNVLLMRDVISATTIPNGGRLTVKYYIRWNG